VKRAWIKRGAKALRRGTELRPKAWLQRGTKRMPRVNAERQARRKAEYRAFMASPEWKAIRKAALARAGHRCEELIPNSMAHRDHGISMMRCTATRRLTVHHRTYARFGGRELPSDLQVLCKEHHDGLHAQQPWKRIA
jgi:5-methylcytosine-specific restriction endonuclease McrA